jgi:hypothetical protein
MALGERPEAGLAEPGEELGVERIVGGDTGDEDVGEAGDRFG